MHPEAAQELVARVRQVLAPLTEGADLRETLDEAFAHICGVSACESVGIRWKAAEDYPYLVTRGFGRDFVVVEGPLCARDAAGLILRHADGTPQLACLCGAVVQGRIDPSQPFFTEGGSFWTSASTIMLRDTPPRAVAGITTRNYCNAIGYESVALIPLKANGEIHGLLQLNSRRPGRFTEERIQEYERVAREIASAVAKRASDLPIR
ncbi:MAG: GAF domain-containing protein [Armatimonadota bacterium]|nr:MAG: GAF domain-containing protein [Armatimonadota bacterium]